MSTRAGLWISPWMVWSLSYLVWSPRHSTMLGLVVGLPLPLAREGMRCVAFGRGRTRSSHVFPFADGTCVPMPRPTFPLPSSFLFHGCVYLLALGKEARRGDVSDLPLAQLQPSPLPSSHRTSLSGSPPPTRGRGDATAPFLGSFSCRLEGDGHHTWECL